MTKSLIWSSDLYKGFKLDKTHQIKIDDLLPFQMIPEEEKTEDWIRCVADFYDTASWVNVEKRAHRIQRNFDLANSKLDPSDYTINPSNIDFYNAVGESPNIGEDSPIRKFYPLIPNIIKLLRGEYIKRDNRMVIEAIDPYSVGEAFQQKEDAFKQVVTNFAMVKKQLEMQKLLQENPDVDIEAAEQKAMEELSLVEKSSKTFRTTGQKWAEKVVKIHESRYNLDELEPDGFETSLITDSAFFHLDMLEDDFRLELINPKWADYHKTKESKYVSKGDYFDWFEFMSAGDIVNKFGWRMKEKDILKLKDIYSHTVAMVVPNSERAFQGAFYDMTKPYHQATELNPNMNNAMLGRELAYNYMRSPNFDHNLEFDILNPTWGRRMSGQPQMFRVMRLYWKSMRRIGWLTKINRDGSMDVPDWIDENYRVTEEPVYDKSVIKEEKKKNLLYGEHIDWTWVPQWRHVIKISPNQKHGFWVNWEDKFDTIYLDGGPTKFQFKGEKNVYDCLPPVEGAEFTWMNSSPNSLVDKLKNHQVFYNICKNKSVKSVLDDIGPKIFMHDSMLGGATISNQEDGMDRQWEFEDKMREGQLVTYGIDPNTLKALGQIPKPEVVNLSTVQETMVYTQLAQMVKEEAGETVGITRSRMAQQKASETATGIQQGINYSESQTEYLFEQYGNLMTRVRQRMLDATQYYSTFKESSREVYINDMEENVFLEMEGMQNLLPQYLIRITNKADVRAALKAIKDMLYQDNTTPIPNSDKIQALLSNSQARMIQVLKEGEEAQIRREEAQRQFEAQQQQQQLEAEQQMHSLELEQKTNSEQAKLENNIDVATIRALGGVQTDADKNGTIDTQDNMASILAQQKIAQQAQVDNTKAQLDRQKQVDNVLMTREKLKADLKKEKMKSDTAKYVANKNKNKFDK